MINKQKPEPRQHDDGDTLDVHSIFSTLQGEGPFTGQKAIFVRLAGCNLQCPACDTEYTEGRKTVTIQSLINDILDKAGKRTSLVVITGGEPMRQNIGLFVRKLLMSGLAVQIESNGRLRPDDILENLLRHETITRLHLCISPKTAKINDICNEHATYFKYVLQHGDIAADGLPIHALGHAVPEGRVVARPKDKSKPVYITPMDSKDPEENRRNYKAVADSAMQFGYIAGVQLHKHLELE